MVIKDKAVKRLFELYRPIKMLEEISYLLDWDMNVNLPEAAGETRGNQTAFVAEQIARHWHDEELAKLLGEILGRLDELSELEQAAVRTLEHAGQFYFKVPPAIVVESARTASESFMVWQQAKKENNFALFAPHLEKTLELSRIIADKLGYDHNSYNALLDLYDQGLTADFIATTFRRLQPQLTDLQSRILKAPEYQANSPLLAEDMLYPQSEQRQLSLFILKKMGYDFTSGRMDISTHPFSTGLGMGDVRITTRYLPHDFRSSFAASMHEGGHALYTQGISPELAEISLESELSFAIHESQSRFWENMVGRHPGFIAYMTPLFQAFFPEQLGQTDAATFVKLFNQVESSLIRIEADEVTYALHIMIRFELENDLINQRLKVLELPEAWRAKCKQYLGIEPQTDREGVLQDVHWSNGYIGYFPSYALGNLYAAQFTHQLRQELPFDELVSRGELGSILAWLRENIHQHGSRYSAAELVQRVTGEELNPQYFTDYLEEKFSAIYKLG
jgi:carboxypeptidase Taq